MEATGGFKPPTDALLQHWSTQIQQLQYFDYIRIVGILVANTLLGEPIIRKYPSPPHDIPVPTVLVITGNLLLFK